MNVQVMSRDDCVRYCHVPHANRVIIISISSTTDCYGTHCPFKSSENGVDAILRLFFDDTDRADAAERPMGEFEARQIKRFLTLHRGMDVIVHCDAGISRSAGVAAAILKALTGDDTQIFDNPKYHPNMLCYRETLNVLMS